MVFRAAGCSCLYTVHKGGAQSLGSVYAEMRIAAGALRTLGASIPPGKLDVLVAMDAWEALRHLRLAHAGTRCFVERDPMPFFTDRASALESEACTVNPYDLLNAVPVSITWRRYRQDAITADGTASMSNYYAGIDCLSALSMKAEDAFRHTFFSTIAVDSARIIK